jgi:hypothetical protein
VHGVGRGELLGVLPGFARCAVGSGAADDVHVFQRQLGADGVNAVAAAAARAALFLAHGVGRRDDQVLERCLRFEIVRPHRQVFLRRFVLAAFEHDLVRVVAPVTGLPRAVEAADHAHAGLEHGDAHVRARLYVNCVELRFDRARRAV